MTSDKTLVRQSDGHAAQLRPARLVSNLFTMPVRTVGETELNRAAVQLYGLAYDGFRPNLLLGVRRGGYVVAECMQAEARSAGVALLPISRCRPSTVKKNKTVLAKKLVRKLPGFVTNRLRVIEHIMLTGRQLPTPGVFVPDRGELADIENFIHVNPTAKILVVDDAVDSGSTLAGILGLLRVVAPHASVKVAVIVTTTRQPLVEPDYSLYHHELCRFPWSIDFKT